jgi:tryptophan 2-monooxygenase
MSSQQRICIVGAGAAGVVAAHHLRRKGYDRVWVFEARDRVGGKCCTVEHEGRCPHQPVRVSRYTARREPELRRE